MALLNSSSPAALAEKERQLVWLLVRQLGEAQASPAGQARAERLWQEVAALEIDPERVIALLYGGHDLEDRAVLASLDPGPSHAPAHRPAPNRVWGRAGLRAQPARGGGRRSAPPAVAPAHPADR
ncbi:MAG: hypothetical protein RLZZ468_201 [Cyanobacteriota bacterium]|jgi:hypothetical protein